MRLFAPWFPRQGLAGLTLPLYLHLLKRQKNPPRPVPSLMFWESRTQSSTRHRRLHYLLLLSLRLALLFLLILAFANPFINRNAATLASNRLVLLVVDNSFSMRAGTRLNDAKDAAIRACLSGKGRRTRASRGLQTAVAADDATDRRSIDAACGGASDSATAMATLNFAEMARAVRA